MSTHESWPGLTLLPPRMGEARHAQVSRTLRESILSGVLAPGLKLPGHRRLAAELGVSRNTLVDALDGLRDEGYLTARGRSGTQVRKVGPAPGAATFGHADLHLSAWAQRALSGQDSDAGGTYDIDFRVGQPVPELYPQAAWAQALARRAGQILDQPLLPYDPLGPPVTRQALATYLSTARGAAVTADMVMLTNGTQSALDALARVFLEEGRRAVVEDPTYPGASAVLAATGAEVIPVPVSAAGLELAHLPAHATLAYVTPGCQYPTTVQMPAEARQALVRWAREAGAYILEDDYAADLHHSGRPPPVLQGLAPERVVLLGSFSKSLAPVTRSGFLVAPPAVIRVLAGTRPLTDRTPGTLDALALADVLLSGAYARNLRRARQVIAHRRDVLLTALGTSLPLWQVMPSQAGLHVCVTLPAFLREGEVIRVAQERGVALTAVTPLRAGSGEAAVLMAFAHLQPEQIREGVRRLAGPLPARPA